MEQTLQELSKESLVKRTQRTMRAIKATNRETVNESMAYLREVGRYVEANPLVCPECKNTNPQTNGCSYHVNKVRNPNGLGFKWKAYGFCRDCGHGTKKFIDKNEGGKLVKVSGWWDITNRIKKVK